MDGLGQIVAVKRTTRENLLLSLSAFTTVMITPFAFIRFNQGEWGIGIVDLLISVCMASIFIYVYKTHRVGLPSVVLAIMFSLGVILSVVVKGVGNIYWIYPVIVSSYYLLTTKWAVILSSMTIALLLPTLYTHLDSIELIKLVATMFATGGFALLFSKSVAAQHKQLEDLATKDSLTGVGNRRALTEKLAELISHQTRQQSKMSLIILDLDHFKSVNDDYGHLVGDQILIRVSEIIAGRLRGADTIYRFGGEEFVILPFELCLELAVKLAEQLRILVENNVLTPNDPVTISLGVAEFKDGETGDNWLKRADEALYKAKEAGRNRVCSVD